jgi:hypothetical protein
MALTPRFTERHLVIYELMGAVMGAKEKWAAKARIS